MGRTAKNASAARPGQHGSTEDAPPVGITLDGPSVAQVKASWNRCEKIYDLDPYARLMYNRYSQSEVGQRMEKVEEPLARGKPLIDQIRSVVKNANYCMLLADDECVAIAEFHDTELARYFKKEGIAIGTFWDESQVGTNGIGTSTADTTAATVNGEQHYHHLLHKFICSAAPLVDHCGRRYGAINLTGKATSSQTEVIRLSQFVRRAADNLHLHVFREFFQNHTLVGIADERFNEVNSMSKLMALDDTGCIVGVTNDLLTQIGVKDRRDLIGTSMDKVIGLEFETLSSSEERLHQLVEGTLGGRYALKLSPTPKRAFARRETPQREQSTSEPSKTAVDSSGSSAPRETILNLDELAGTDARMIKHVALCRRLINNQNSASAIPLLLSGETGTGKDAFARALHAESDRHMMPYVELNCASIPESLLDSELFGYAPGTFTGGLKEGKRGHILAANGGTLFLDEIGDMPLASQTRLLRVLSERIVQPLGESRQVAVDFALVCASHRDLSERVQQGLFREDLYYRVCGAKITLPALRDRTDLKLIAKRLLQQIDPQNLVDLSDEIWERLCNYFWPGNIRQLLNTLQFVVYSCGEGVAGLSDLPEELQQRYSPDSRMLKQSQTQNQPPLATAYSHRSGHTTQTSSRTSDLDNQLHLSKRDELINALQQARWCVAKAARIVGVSRATVHRQMKKYNIVRPDHQG